MKTDSLQTILDETHSRLAMPPNEAAAAVASLGRALRMLKRQERPDEWELIIEQCRRHPLLALLHEDPLTERAFTKPRKYQGDAELLDIIYRCDWRGICQRNVTQLGQAIFAYTIACKAPSAVRIRRDMLTRMIDETCERAKAPHILSVACGHLREAGQSHAVRTGGIERFVGLDQDLISLNTVKRELSRYKVETINGSIRLLLSGSLAKQKFDFIYAAGLYDYLEERLAQRLTEQMFEMLRPDGRLLVANFLPDIEDVGYMEPYGNWRLIYRDAAAMEKLAAGISLSLISSKHVYNDISDTIVFLQLERSP